MSYSNELTIKRLRDSGANNDLLQQLEQVDAEIDVILRSGGTSQDVRETQQLFDDLSAAAVGAAVQPVPSGHTGAGHQTQ